MVENSTTDVPRFENIHAQDFAYNKKHVNCDYRVYDLNNRVIFYVCSSTTQINRGGPFSLKFLNKDQKDVSEFLRAEPRRKINYLPCLSTLYQTRDEIEILDNSGKCIGTSLLIESFWQGIQIQGSKGQFMGEIRQKIISSGDAHHHYKGLTCWFPHPIPVYHKLHILSAAFLLEIDFFSDKAIRRIPFHDPEIEYLIPIIKTPPYHERVRREHRKKHAKPHEVIAEGEKESKDEADEKRGEVMPFIAHIRGILSSTTTNSTAAETTEIEKEKPHVEGEKEPCAGSNIIFGMDREAFRKATVRVVDYVMRQDETLREQRCAPATRPGYLRALLPTRPPDHPDDLDDILEDYHKLIVPGLVQSCHPKFFGSFPSGNFFPCLIAELLAPHTEDHGGGSVASPALMELEVIMMDWLGETMGLPKELLFFPDCSRGGGCMQVCQSDANLTTMIAARNAAISKYKKDQNESSELIGKLVAYTSPEAHPSITKAAKSAMVTLRVLPTDEKMSLRGTVLQLAIAKDRRDGLIPFFVAATFGTSTTCSFDNVAEIGPVCRDAGVWLHVDGSYAGSGMMCQETRHLMKGLVYADSFITTPSKLVLSVCDVCCLWVRDRVQLESACDSDNFSSQPSAFCTGLPLSRRYGALRLWFVLRISGVEQIQRQIREHIRLGKFFETLLLGNKRFVICNSVLFGIICFRSIFSDNFNKVLLHRLNESAKLHLSGCQVNGAFCLRLCINTPRTTEEDLEASFKVICNHLDQIMPYQTTISQMTCDELDTYLKIPKRGKPRKTQSTISSLSETASNIRVNTVKPSADKCARMKMFRNSKSSEASMK
ncbi:unnamed protein product [Caenorhabditis bovis]|uniref:Aromatic-L-amino-acid decarboxylase n=1 Tax=Caenorhabditis bovis TaxID=2654633 RepID=A0A8S1F8G3_9PELO|nr:unnamed protein product [Caenorhabditis bovis]